MCVIPVLYGVGTKEDYSTVSTYFPLEKNEKGTIKTKNIAVCQKCYGHVHAKGAIPQI